MAMPPGGKTLWVANDTPINTATNKSGQPIPVHRAGTPSMIVIAPGGRTAYVVGIDGAYLITVRTATSAAGPPLRVSGDPCGIALPRTGTTAYVLTCKTGAVLPVNTSTGAIGRSVRVGPLPTAIALVP
jgi:hyaluronoglucosaminidase